MNLQHIICITNRKLIPVQGTQPTEPDLSACLLSQIERLSRTDAECIILREKDMDEASYQELARQALDICNTYHKKLVFHTYIKAASALHHPHIHLPYPVLEAHMQASDHSVHYSARWKTMGVSIHSLEEAIQAERLGATYLTAGHIFATDCKKGLPPRGLDWLRNITENVSIPVYALGGITEDNLPLVMQYGAAGGCMMSGAMRYPH